MEVLLIPRENLRKTKALYHAFNLSESFFTHLKRLCFLHDRGRIRPNSLPMTLEANCEVGNPHDTDVGCLPNRSEPEKLTFALVNIVLSSASPRSVVVERLAHFAVRTVGEMLAFATTPHPAVRCVV